MSIGSGVSGVIERTAMAETLAELSARVDELERVILERVRKAKRNEIKAAVKARQDQREDEGGYEITSLIG